MYRSITVITVEQDKEVQVFEDKRCGVYVHQNPSNKLTAAQSNMVSKSARLYVAVISWMDITSFRKLEAQHGFPFNLIMPSSNLLILIIHLNSLK